MVTATEEGIGRRHIVLVVDDEELIRSALQRLLRREPYDVIFVENGQQAFEQLTSRSVDMIVSDYRMPGVNGVELLSSVRKQFPGVLRVLLTGSIGHDEIVQAKRRGDIEAFLQKPWDNAELLDEMKRLLMEKGQGAGDKGRRA